MSKLLLAIAAFGASLAVSASAQDQAAPMDHSGKGAVLCAQAILMSVQVIGNKCMPNQDLALKAELTSSLARIDKFVLQNSKTPITAAELSANRRGVESEITCKGDQTKFYTVFVRQTPTQLRTYVDDLLSVPREPLMNPCL